PALLAAYLLFYWPISYAQTRRLLAELPRIAGRALDVGSGPGPAAFALADAGAGPVIAADRSLPALRLAARLASQARLTVETRRWNGDTALPDGKFAV